MLATSYALGGSFCCGEREEIFIVSYLFGINSTMSGPHSFSVRRRKEIRAAGTEDMSLLDVEEF